MNIIMIIPKILVLLIISGVIHGQDFNKKPWLEDFAQLKLEIGSKYANLDWSVKARGLDLKLLSGKTETLLQQARNESEAKRIIETFINTFGDGHLMIQWATQKKEALPIRSDTTYPLADLCTRLGYETLNQATRMPFKLLKNYREIQTTDSKHFSIGILLAGRSSVGIIRIPVFSETMYAGLCEMAIKELGLNNTSPCNNLCEERLSLKAADLLSAALVRQVEVLKKEKIGLLLVDITGNGGGTNWTEAAARTLSAQSLQSPRQQFIKHKHWISQLKKRLEIVEADLITSTQSHGELLKSAAEKLRTAIAQTEQTCDRGMVWENQTPLCDLVVDSPSLYPQSVLSYSPPGSLPDLPSSQALFYPARYKYKEGVYSGKLMILVDAGTWSSAEYFAAMLKDNNAATIIGQPTGGAGCGYTNGGIPTFLKNSGAKVKIPDCIRLRSDGTNEVEGITPDILVPWRPTDNHFQKVNRFIESLSEYLSESGGK